MKKRIALLVLVFTVIATTCTMFPLSAAEAEPSYLFLSDLTDQIVSEKTVQGAWIGLDGFFDPTRDKNLAGGYRF